MRSLYFGDNLDILREHVRDESVDLVYLDPPFNSKRDYNLLFKTPKGQSSDAQITAFEDSWHWGEQAETEYSEILHQSNTEVAGMIEALRRFLGESDMLAYLAMMANRLIELRRVLKPTGSLYLHCDPTASHYLKIVLDAVFGHQNYRNEIIWRRSNPKSHITRNFPLCTDTLFRFSKSENATFHQPYTAHDEKYTTAAYRYKDSKGRYRLLPLLNPNDNRPNLTYEFLGVTRVWRWTHDRMEAAYRDGLVVQLKPGSVPQYKKYLDDSKGKTVTNLWADIEQAAGNENLGYPTQKPLALLERIINASSNPGDIVLDPFCGCGTAVHAAEKLGRGWIGIDITHLAVSLIERRMKDAFPGIAFEVHGTPKDHAGARNLAERDKYQFQFWALSLVNAQPYKSGKKGADGGTDGLIYFQDDKGAAKKIVVSVKGGESVTRTMIADLKNTVEREKATIGLFVTLAPPTQPMITEAASAGFYESPLHGSFPKIQILTIEGLLDGREQPRYPDMARGAHTFRQAKREEEGTEQPKLLGE